MEFAIQNSKFESLKSNMDRFIVCRSALALWQYLCLKSNMDRFIVSVLILMIYLIYCLKSNMDRFIDPC